MKLIRRPWYEILQMRLRNWWSFYIGTRETCFWCGRTFLWRNNGHCYITADEADVLCSEECVHEYAKTL